MFFLFLFFFVIPAQAGIHVFFCFCFVNLNFEHSNLFSISKLGFRICFSLSFPRKRESSFSFLCSTAALGCET